MTVTYFRDRRLGPELELEDAVATQGPDLFMSESPSVWTAGSLPLGAGMPDLTFVGFDPEIVVALSGVDSPIVNVIAYLRAVREARPETIAGRVNRPLRVIEKQLADLVDARVVESVGNAFGLKEPIRNALPEIITVEAKVQDWNRALSQAARNTLFSHHSYVALPEHIAQRVKSESRFTRFGVGVLGVDDGLVRVVRRSRRHHPRVWYYYYLLAVQLANHALGNKFAIPDSNRRRSA